MPGIYLHIPFCKQACNYCNFHFSTSLKHKDALINALTKEIFITADIDASDEQINTIYFGGGTPSILNIAELNQILAALRKRFSIASDAEITLEANPDDITDEKLLAWRGAGIDRLSVGIQSFLEEELVWMNRAHTAAESMLCIDKIFSAGFTNFSIDLIYGSPLLSDENWQKNMQIVIDKKIPHISAYALTVEPKTALDKQILLGKKQAVDSERQAAHFTQLMDAMKANGYEHYEISNFALPGFRSRHNSNYWNGEKYYGFGPAAHAFDGKRRRWNIANNALYTQGINSGISVSEEEILTETQQVNEYIMTALRTLEGIDLEKVYNQFGKENKESLIANSQKYIATKKMILQNDKLILTNEGKLFADGIAADLFF